MPTPVLGHAQHVVDVMGIRAGDRVLDLGCGRGPHLPSLVRGGVAMVVALDIRYADLLAVQVTGVAGRIDGRGSVATHVGRLCADALRIPCVDATFDAVLCSLVAYLLPLEVTLREIARVLKANGRLYIRMPLLGWGRVPPVFERGRTWRERLYVVGHLMNGTAFAVTGRQVRNPLMRHDAWAQYVPLKRFLAASRLAGLELVRADRVLPRGRAASLDAWLVKR